MPRVVIVGAGISGLALAYRLQQRASGLDITLLEQEARPGGKIWTHRHEGFQIECGPNGFLDTKPSTLTLCRDLGLGERLVAASEASARNRYLLLGDRLQPLPGGLFSFLTSGVLSWRGKLNLLLERFRRRGAPREDESIAAFARRRAGREVADVLADALVTGIHAGDPELLSVRAAFPRIAALEAEHGSVLKGLARSARERRARGDSESPRGNMWSFRDGLRLLVETLSGSLKQPPLFGVSIRAVHKRSEPPAWEVSADGRDVWSADAVVLACPAYQQSASLMELDRELAGCVGAIPYNRIAVVALGYRRAEVPVALDGFGFIAPQNTRRDLLGVQWCSSIYAERAPQGMVLLRALAGGWHRPEIVGWDDAPLIQALRAELRLAMKITAAPVMHHIVRWDRAIPQYHVGHLERLAWIENRLAQHPGLFLAGNAYHGVAMNDCTEQAELLAGRVERFLSERSL